MLAVVQRTFRIAAVPARARGLPAGVFVVIDCLRATTTIATLFDAGLAGLWAVEDLDLAREIARRESALLFGEVGGLPPAGFDGGNSPVEAREAPVRGRRAVLFTTNGTRALTDLAGRGRVVAACIGNAGPVARFVDGEATVGLVCSGEDGGSAFALEDFAAAAVIARELAGLPAPYCPGDDLACLAVAIETPEALVAKAGHAVALRGLGLGADVTYSATIGTSSSVPMVTAHGQGWAYLELAAG